MSRMLAGTLLLDTAKRSWSREIINELSIPYDFFPLLYESPQITGRVTKKIAKEIFLKQGTLIFAGGADQVMMAIGNGVVEMEGLASRIGTGGLLITVTDHLVIKSNKVLYTIPTPFLKNGFLWGRFFPGDHL